MPMLLIKRLQNRLDAVLGGPTQTEAVDFAKKRPLFFIEVNVDANESGRLLKAAISLRVQMECVSTHTPSRRV